MTLLRSGAPGLKASVSYLRGQDIKATNGIGKDQTEWERDLRVDYVIQTARAERVWYDSASRYLPWRHQHSCARPDPSDLQLHLQLPVTISSLRNKGPRTDAGPFSDNEETILKLIDSITQFHGELRQIRRDIHAHPELGYEEQRTSDLVAQKLTQWGIPVLRGMGGTGVVGVIKNGDSPRAIGLRADMDALPMQELNTFAHASRHEGKMHSCGHDGHTTMLLGAAHYLSQQRNFDGTVYVIFQPAEEVGGRRQANDG
jgi:hypothetical protein